MSSGTEIDIEACDAKVYSKLRFANSGPFGYGAFSTTLMTLSLSMMGIRNVENQAVFIANLCFLAGIGLLISAQWEMLRGNTFAYTTLIAFAFYYGGYGFLLIPSVGIMDGYGGKTADYFNAFGFYLAVMITWGDYNIVNVFVYGALEFSYIFNCAANFAFADGHASSGKSLTKVAGSFGFIAALAGFYAMANGFCGDVLPFEMPLGDLSRVLSRQKSARRQG
ncbi:Acetate transporter protein patA [Colletotrichum gloeosporioides]|uniref:Acetate transporter protein patA n=1 Tax=Colletotrichum gloeosporioides TaxID=474922 RepID=A0A8H4CG23_COLGL|nr:Acetate transporter protein patA [Colletotrichum gloeosporioides]KAF3803243.1 Acetate transporter protein patA [Colletotrichum gloeosporioides]